ncbi:type 1 glutamine amidotransferase [Kibdelosporangium aridum]|uniref:Type 1 glutamine amidotransferase n=1 Tax=Kibdelosporangium aridum TaxID=2030 RepID=A0A428Z3T4_KIBAR|nr:type 1 glutamine amidotransferase domain-containing protein [Kibdelosporangium aridum]RSM80885.1 type 1 glutamine amidotransferase [Kibdelosporangium aridum]
MARLAFLMDIMFQDKEFQVPYDRARQAGHETVIVGLERGKRLTALSGAEAVTDRAIEEVTAEEFDAVVIPGGYSPDKIRTSQPMVGLVRRVFEANKPVAAICHAGWMLAEADVARGRTVTSWPSIRTDLRNAGADWIDQEVVVDGNLITSRNPGDVPAFCDALLKHLK